MANLHRNNAAEWVMTIVVMPFVWIARGWKRWRSFRASVETSGSAKNKPARRSVMIEGLPPRTLN